MDQSEEVAKKFHEAYEELAPSHGYETRKESAVPWDEVPEQNKNLMKAVIDRLLKERGIKLGSGDAVVEYLDDPIIGFVGGSIPQQMREDLFDVFEKYGLTRGEWISALMDAEGILLTFGAKKDGYYLVSGDQPVMQEAHLKWEKEEQE